MIENSKRTLEDESIWFYVIEDLDLIKEQLLSVEGGVEQDPVFTASPAYTITSQNIGTWNTALQPSALNGYATETWVTSQNYLTSAVTSVTAGDNITVDNTDPLNPIVSSTGETGLLSGEVFSGDVDTLDNEQTGISIFEIEGGTNTPGNEDGSVVHFQRVVQTGMGEYQLFTSVSTSNPGVFLRWRINANTYSEWSLIATAADLGTAASSDIADFATASQGSLADSAVQPGDLATVATTGAYSDLIGTPTLFSGNYGDLTGVPSTFTPSAHTHNASDINTGVLAEARIPTLPQSKVTNLVTNLASKLTATQGAAVPDSTAADLTTLVSDFNSLLASLRTAGIIAT